LSHLTNEDKDSLRQLMWSASPDEFKGHIERAAIETLMTWAEGKGFYYSRVTPQKDEDNCADSGDEKFGQMDPQRATAKQRNYPYALDIHRGTEPQLPDSRQWIPLLRELVAFGQSLQKGMRDRITLTVKLGALTSSDDPDQTFEVKPSKKADQFYRFVRIIGIKHKKEGSYLYIPLLNLEQWMQENSLIVAPSTNPPSCSKETERKSLMNVEGKWSMDDILTTAKNFTNDLASASSKAEVTSIKKKIATFNDKVKTMVDIYSDPEVRKIDQTMDRLNQQLNTRIQTLS